MHCCVHACRKIFVGGLASETSEADLKEYFGVYGELTDIVVMRGDIVVSMLRLCSPCGSYLLCGA